MKYPPQMPHYKKAKKVYKKGGFSDNSKAKYQITVSYGNIGEFGLSYCFLKEQAGRTNRVVQHFNESKKGVICGCCIDKYKSPVGYPSWDWYMNFMAQLMDEQRVELIEEDIVNKCKTTDDIDPISKSFLLAGISTIQPTAPIYLTHEIISDLSKTDFKGFENAPPDVLPMYTFMLPKSALRYTSTGDSSDKDEVEYESFTTIVVIPNERFREEVNEVLRTGDLKNIFNEYLKTHSENRCSVAGFKLLALSDKAGWIVGDYSWKDATTPKKYDDEISQVLLNIAINAILLMSHQPEYITQQSPLLGGRGFSNKNLPQPAKWLGENYESQNTRYEYPPDYVPSKGKSPRSHWRRGHMRHVCQGKGRKQRMLTWIKPVFVTGRGLAA
tara:strand:- start:3809 stop:4963 length:1155 start_codon:yes stop_codon:yes gene_type:complete